jgi:cytidyltransferase-like protein
MAAVLHPPAHTSKSERGATRAFKIVCVSGWFDPLHLGHVEYLKNAKILGDKLVVILNTDSQRRPGVKLKHNAAQRSQLVGSIRYVDQVVLSIDCDENVSETLRQVNPHVFAKGLAPSVSELEVCRELNIEVVENVGDQIHLHDLILEFS